MSLRAWLVGARASVPATDARRVGHDISRCRLVDHSPLAHRRSRVARARLGRRGVRCLGLGAPGRLLGFQVRADLELLLRVGVVRAVHERRVLRRALRRAGSRHI